VEEAADYANPPMVPANHTLSVIDASELKVTGDIKSVMARGRHVGLVGLTRAIKPEGPSACWMVAEPTTLGIICMYINVSGGGTDIEVWLISFGYFSGDYLFLGLFTRAFPTGTRECSSDCHENAVCKRQ